MKSLFCYVITVCLGVMSIWAATPTITSVTAQQRYPWNGKVDISYKVTGDIAGMALTNGLITTLKVTATDKVANKSYTATTAALSGSTTLTAGNHAIVWDLGQQGVNLKSANVVFNVSCETNAALYCVIDLSAGAEATSYPVTYLASAPSNGFTNNTYRTTKLALRRCNAGSFKMQGTKTVVLSKGFYIGVFPVTKKQWNLVMGTTPWSGYNCNTSSSTPAELLNYNMLRGDSVGSKWPSQTGVDSFSFLGKLRARTKLDFDLPTEAQWEYSCRAGTTTKFYWGDAVDYDYLVCHENGVRANAVGSKKANAWGLYDMSGNVWEWCRDWDGGLSGGTDPNGPTTGSKRVVRGGYYDSSVSDCTSSSRSSLTPSDDYGYYGYYGGLGVRISRTLP